MLLQSGRFGVTFTTPADLSPFQWFDGSDSASITASGGFISQWADKSGNSRHLTQASGTNQPQVSAAAVNGLDAVTFGGVDDYMTYDAGSDAISLASGLSMYAVVKNADASIGASDYRRIITMRRSATGAGDFQSPNFLVSLDGAAGGWLSILNGDATTLVDATACGTSAQRIAVIHDGTTGYLRRGGAQVDTGAMSAAGTMRYVRVGAACKSTNNPPDVTTAVEFWSGLICEVVVCLRALSSGESDALEAYFATKWGVS